MREENVAFNRATKILEMQMSTAENTSIFPKKYKEGKLPPPLNIVESQGDSQKTPPPRES